MTFNSSNPRTIKLNSAALLNVFGNRNCTCHSSLHLEPDISVSQQSIRTNLLRKYHSKATGAYTLRYSKNIGLDNYGVYFFI